MAGQKDEYGMDVKYSKKNATGFPVAFYDNGLEKTRTSDLTLIRRAL